VYLPFIPNKNIVEIHFWHSIALHWRQNQAFPTKIHTPTCAGVSDAAWLAI